jgi:RNA recognition motif-containing protein
LMQDKFTGKSRGFAFVTMTTEADAQKAITEFNGKTVEGRPLTVNEARPREARPPGGGRSGGGGYGGGGGGYGGGGGGYGGGGGGYGGGGGSGGGRRDSGGGQRRGR